MHRDWYPLPNCHVAEPGSQRFQLRSTGAMTGGVDEDPDTFVWKGALVYTPALIPHESDARESLPPHGSHLDN